MENRKQFVENKSAFAEVIDSSLDNFIAQSWQWDSFPAFGSLVYVTSGSSKILGCVTAVKTGSMDPVRYPFPYQKTEEELKAEQPQIFEFLKTTFTVTVLGYRDAAESFFYLLPPTPAKIHAFVCRCSSALSIEFLLQPDFLYLLFASQNSISHFDDLLLAVFSYLSKEKKLTSSVLDSFCQTLSLFTGNDYRRMKLFLRRLERTI